MTAAFEDRCLASLQASGEKPSVGEYFHPMPGVSGPGAQRIVTGAGGDLYYTGDHYQTFN
jgi:guanyl-specific ribonuclease Sa